MLVASENMCHLKVQRAYLVRRIVFEFQYTHCILCVPLVLQIQTQYQVQGKGYFSFFAAAAPACLIGTQHRPRFRLIDWPEIKI
jgi:hypothetical protein